MKVAEVMTRSVATCYARETLNDAARIMWERDCGVVPIVSDADRRVVGVITDRDICIAAYTQGRPLVQIRIGEVMSPRITTCRADDEISAVEQSMQQAQVHRLPVLDDGGKLVGIVSLADLTRASAGRNTRAAEGKVTPLDIGETVTAIRKPRQLEAAVGI
jgi:CBS domain-containing protein